MDTNEKKSGAGGEPGAQSLPAERAALGLLGTAFLLGGFRARSGLISVLFGGTGLGLLTLALREQNPIATALKIDAEDGRVSVRDAVTVSKDRDAVYRIWRDFSGLPRLMGHLQAVEELEGGRSRWTAEAPPPLGTVSWEAELTADEPGRRIAWQSIPGSGITNSGEVLLRDAPGGRGTELVVRLEYVPPGGVTGALLARMFGQEPAQQLRDDLMRFKREQELGYAPTTEGQSSGRKGGNA